MKPVDSTWYYAKVLPNGEVTITSVTLRDTGAQTLAVVGGDRFLARHQKRVTRAEVQAGDGRAAGALGLRSSKRAAVLAAIRRAEASMNLAVDHHRVAARNREALMEELKRHEPPEPVVTCVVCEDEVVESAAVYCEVAAEYRCERCEEQLLTGSLAAAGGERLARQTARYEREAREYEREAQ